MAKPQSEPTMDEILASIRRIISEDDDAPAENKAPTLGPLELDEASSVSVDDDDLSDAPEVEAQEPELAAVEAPTEEAAEEVEAAAAAEEVEAPEFAPQLEAAPEIAEDPVAEEAPALTAEAEAPVADAAVDPLDDIEPAPQPESEAPVAPKAKSEDAISFAAISERASRASAVPSSDGLVSSASAQLAAQAFGSLHENMRVSQAGGRTIEDVVEEMLRPMIQAWLDDNLPRIVEEKVEEEVRRIARRQ